ncbi:hypothetical protein HZH68_005669 [Vespula germanica]|uniref:Uncharacterized protein n=1 Tax=Vespula germanica TaxID=30212 RepID=A0A834KGN5_VESGE|nr:hypothetical protein HZH68_005669 [Vespula germanica]
MSSTFSDVVVFTLLYRCATTDVPSEITCEVSGQSPNRPTLKNGALNGTCPETQGLGARSEVVGRELGGDGGDGGGKRGERQGRVSKPAGRKEEKE